MISLEYNQGTYSNPKWVNCGVFENENIAWISLGGDDRNYRTIGDNDKVLTDKSYCSEHRESAEKGYCSGCANDELMDNQI